MGGGSAHIGKTHRNTPSYCPNQDHCRRTGRRNMDMPIIKRTGHRDGDPEHSQQESACGRRNPGRRILSREPMGDQTDRKNHEPDQRWKSNTRRLGKRGIVYIYKNKGDAGGCGNYRPICITQIIYKIFT